MNSIKLMQLSKSVSHALRHEPKAYNLDLDAQGWALISDLVFALNCKGIQVDENIIIDMIESSEKKRHQISNGKIRAYYGHSVEIDILKCPVEPPNFLYHGTTKSIWDSITEKGLLPMGRQYVHFSSDERDAKIVGSRKKGDLLILKVESKEAYIDHIQFYKEENGVWLSKEIPLKYIEINGIN
jgi:putative RNA 2'-phosphotransferase